MTLQRTPFGLAAAAVAVGWTALVAAAPQGFFLWAALLASSWIALSVAALGRVAVVPTRTGLAVGLASGAILYGLSRLFLWLFCGGPSQVLCGPLHEVLARFETRGVIPALVLVLLVAPAEELFWRGVVQGSLARRTSPWAAVALTALLSSALLALFGQWLLALAALPTSLVWGALTVWRGRLASAVVSHAFWDLLIAVLMPPG